MFVGIGKSCIFASLFERRVLLKEVWRGGRVVDYSGLENRRTATFRGFESLPLRKKVLSVSSLRELTLFSFCNFSTNKLRKNERNHCQILASAYCAFVCVLSAMFHPIPY